MMMMMTNLLQIGLQHITPQRILIAGCSGGYHTLGAISLNTGAASVDGGARSGIQLNLSPG